MNLFLKSLCAAGFLSLSAIPALSQAAVIDFNNTADDNGIVNVLAGDTYTEDGFVMTTTADSVLLVDDDAAAGLGGEQFDDDFLLFDNDNAAVSFGRVGGGTFSLSSALIGTVTDDSTYTFTGFFSGGGSISQEVAGILDAAATFNFVGFDNLLSLAIVGAPDGRFPAIDNIVLTETANVPLPAAAPLLASGLLGLGMLGWRRRVA